MGRVIVVGSINVDFTVVAPRLPRAGETVIGGDFQRGGGGKGANQAVAAARMGARVLMLGAVGDDDLGEAALAELRAEGVDVARCTRFTGTPTGIALIVVDGAGENQIAVASGANQRLDAPALARALSEMHGTPADVLLTGFEIEDDVIEVAVRWAAHHGVRVVLNPAPWREIRPSIIAAHPVLTPNEHEAAALTGESDPARAAQSLHVRTDAPVLITLGAEGALLLDGGGLAIRLRALPVKAVDTTGAGDAFNGILAAQLATGSGMHAAARLAAVGASLSTAQAGARTSPAREVLERAALPEG